MTRSDDLWELGRRCLGQLEIPNPQYAYVGGSVGRGEADDYSDIDITVCVDHSDACEEVTLTYEGEFVQVEFAAPIAPTAVRQRPLDHRFLLESRGLYDPRGQFRTALTEVRNCLTSVSGRTRMFRQWHDLVQRRLQWTSQGFSSGFTYDATVAAGAAWADAAFMAMFFDTGSLSTDRLIPWIKAHGDWLPAIVDLSPWLRVSDSDVPSMLRTVEQFRGFVRTHAETRAGFVVSQLQDTLMGNKARRLLLGGEVPSLAWQLAGEAFWIYLTSSHGVPLDTYLAGLPRDLTRDLEKVGMVALDACSVRELCRIADDMRRGIPTPA